MKWSHNRPIQPGAFWFRDSRRGIAETVVDVEAVPQMGLIARKELCFDGEPVSACPETAEWAGPIQRPR